MASILRIYGRNGDRWFYSAGMGDATIRAADASKGYDDEIPIDADRAIRRSTVLARGSTPQFSIARSRPVNSSASARGCMCAPGRNRRTCHRLMLGVVATSPKEVLSHESAAVLYGLPMLRPDLREVHLTVPPTAERVYDEFGGAIPRCCRPATSWNCGHCVTSLERTAVDVARTSSMGFAGALAVFDAALRRGARMRPGWLSGCDGVAARGCRRRCATPRPLADGVGESWCRAQLLSAGLPRPRLKHALLEDGDEEMVQPDMDWSGLVLGEFDGAARYERVRVPGDTALSASWRAIARDDRLRERGIRVLRWTWSDLERHDVAASCRYRLSGRV